MEVRELIRQAALRSRLVSYGGQGLNANEYSDALINLNIIANELAITGDALGIIKQMKVSEFEGNTVDLPDVSVVQRVDYWLGNVRSRVKIATMQSYFDMAVLDPGTVGGIPFVCYPERTGGGTKLYLYFTPEPKSAIELAVCKRLKNIELDDVIGPSEDNIDPAYMNYLLSSLAKAFLQIQGLPIPQDLKNDIRDQKSQLERIKPMETSIRIKKWGSGGIDSPENVAIKQLTRGITP